MGPRSKSRLAGSPGLVGLLVRIPSEDLIEMAGVAGFDFVVVDCEHGPADVNELRRHITVAQLHGMDTMVRVGSDEPALVLRALDQGAAGIIAPHVDTAAEAAALVSAVHYPPLGTRGFATYTRAGGFGSVPPTEHRDERTAETVVVAMIESPLGVANTVEIAATAGIDAIMIGTADLAVASSADDLPLDQAVATVHRGITAAGALRMDIVSSEEQAASALAAGAQLVVYNTAHVIMTQLRQLRRPRPTPPAP